MYDFHIHSNFSHDCKYSMEDMIKSAVNKNAKTIAFTDHVDLEYGGNKIDFAFIPSDYLKEIKRLKNNYKNIIGILSGVEIGLQPHLSEKANRFLQEGNYDIILLSVHTAKNQELYGGHYFKKRTSLQVFEDYYNDLLDILDTFDNFDIVSHLNLLERYKNYIKESIELNDYRDLLIEVLKKIIDMGKGIEINTSGMRSNLNEFLPNKYILKMYKKLGGEIITIGSDAHTPKDICSYYSEAVNLLKDIGFRYISMFRNRRSHFIKL